MIPEVNGRYLEKRRRSSVLVEQATRTHRRSLDYALALSVSVAAASEPLILLLLGTAAAFADSAAHRFHWSTAGKDGTDP